MTFETVGIRLEADNASAYFGAVAKGATATDAFSAATAAAAAQVNVFDDSLRKAKVETLTDKLDSQQKKLKILEQELTETSKKYGEGSVQAQKKALAVDDLSKTIVQTEKKIESENVALGREKAAFDAAAHAASVSTPEVEKLGKATGQAGEEAEKTGPKFKSLSEIATGALRQIGVIAVEAFAQAGQAALGFFKDSISVAGDFESGMNKFAAVAGGAIDDAGLSLKDFRDQFIQIGKELPVSTQEVQQAAIEMVKGGISPAVIAAGGLKQVIQFAAAADLDLAEASTIAAKALGGWIDAGASATEQTEFLNHSTDLLSKAANASTVNVDDLALGLYNVQGTAKLAGVSFDETVTSLAELAPSFASSADAGTSFKAFLSRLQPTTKPAIAAMKGLGLYTDEAGSAFYDAQGKFIGMEKVSGLLKDATKGLTDAQRESVLQTIFGQDAIRVAAVLSEKGAEGYDAMTDALAKQQSVADMAKQKQAGFNTALDNFKGSIEALQITIGTVLLPVLTTLFNDYLAPGINILTDLASAGTVSSDTFNKLSPTMQGVAVALEGLWQGIQTGIDIIGGLIVLFQGAGDESSFLSGVLIDLSGTWFILQAVVEKAANAYMGIVSAVLPIIQGFIEDHGDEILSIFQEVWDTIIDIIDLAFAVIQKIIIPILTAIAQFITENQDTILRIITNVWNVIKSVIDIALALIQGIIKTALALLNGDFQGALDELKAMNERIWNDIKQVIGAVWDTIVLILEGVWEDIKHKAELAWAAILQSISAALDSVKKAFNDVVDAILGIWDGLIGQSNGIGTNIIHGIIEGVRNAANQLFDVLRGIALDALESAKHALGITSPSKEFIEIGENTVAGLVMGIERTNKNVFGVIDDTLKTMGELFSKGDLPDQARSLGQFIMEGIGDGIAMAADAAVDQINDAARRMNDAMAGAVSLGAPGSGGDLWNNNMVIGPPNNMQTINAPPNAALLMAAGGMSNTTNNNQRSVALNYHTIYAPPASTSLAIASALAG